MGVGVISGFETTCINLNLWDTNDGIKVDGKTKKLTLTSVYMKKINQVGLEILPTANIDDVIINSCYFTYQGEIGIKLNEGCSIDQGRLAYNFFRGPLVQLKGFNSFTPGWEMNNNGLQIPDSKGKGYIFSNDNGIETKLNKKNFVKISAQTKTLKTDKFIASGNNRLQYTGKRLTNLEVIATISAISNHQDGSYSIAIMKNGSQLILPKATMNNIPKGRGFEIRLDSQVQMIAGDYIELFIKSNVESKSEKIIVTDMQLKVYEQ